MRVVKLTPEKLTAFCAALAETAVVGKACKAVGIARQTAYEWREEVPGFAAMWDKALKVGVSALEDEAHRRAFEGVDEPLTHQGQITPAYAVVVDELTGEVVRDEATGTPKMRPIYEADGTMRPQTVKKYSDTLAIFLLKAHAPEKYRDNSKVELAGRVELAHLSDAEIDQQLAETLALLGADAQPKPADDDGYCDLC